MIENLVLDANGQIEFVGGVLPVWTLREVNQRNYQKLVKKNGLSREIQTQLEVWKKVGVSLGSKTDWKDNGDSKICLPAL